MIDHQKRANERLLPINIFIEVIVATYVLPKYNKKFILKINPYYKLLLYVTRIY